MNNKLLLTLTIMVGQAMAMDSPTEMTREEQLVIPKDTTEEKVVITINGEGREIPIRYIPLMGTLSVLYKEGDAQLQMSPITLVNLDTWQLIEDQLERIYEMTQGNKQMKEDIISDYSQLDSTILIDLIRVVGFLDIYLLRDIVLEVAQDNLTIAEILELPDLLRNEVVKREVLKSNIMIIECGNVSGILSLCSLDGERILIGAVKGTICIWDRCINEGEDSQAHEDAVNSVCTTSNGKIVSGSKDKTVRIWDGVVPTVYQGHEGPVTSVCTTSDDKIVSGSEDRTVRIWGDQLVICQGHEGPVTSVCATTNGKIVSGSEDGTVRIWAMNGRQLAIFQGQGDPVRSVCVTNNNRIVSLEGSYIRFRDANGRVLEVLPIRGAAVVSMCVGPNNSIIFGSEDETVRILDICLLDRLSVMSEEQAELLYNKAQLNLKTLQWFEGHFDEDDETRIVDGITKHFFEFIDNVLCGRIGGAAKKRKELLENGEKNAAKKARLEEELDKENK
jgi:hypothetical protein